MRSRRQCQRGATPRPPLQAALCALPVQPGTGPARHAVFAMLPCAAGSCLADTHVDEILRGVGQRADVTALDWPHVLTRMGAAGGLSAARGQWQSQCGGCGSCNKWGPANSSRGAWEATDSLPHPAQHVQVAGPTCTGLMTCVPRLCAGAARTCTRSPAAAAGRCRRPAR
jgi:hypothetical protein